MGCDNFSLIMKCFKAASSGHGWSASPKEKLKSNMPGGGSEGTLGNATYTVGGADQPAKDGEFIIRSPADFQKFLCDARRVVPPRGRHGHYRAAAAAAAPAAAATRARGVCAAAAAAPPPLTG